MVNTLLASNKIDGFCICFELFMNGMLETISHHHLRACQKGGARGHTTPTELASAFYQVAQGACFYVIV